MSLRFPEETLAKLPKWAQDHIKSLSRERDHWKEQFESVTAPVTEDTQITWSDGLRSEERALPKGATVRFKLGEWDFQYVDVDVDFQHSDRLRIMAGRWMMIRPEASNRLNIRVDKD